MKGERKRCHVSELTDSNPVNHMDSLSQITIRTMPPLESCIGEVRCISSSSAVSVDACANFKHTKIIVRVMVITRSQTTEEATHPMMTPMNFEKSAKRPTLTVKNV